MNTSETIDREFAFVLMPFDPEFDGIFQDLIKAPLTDVGYNVKRADNIANQQNILKDIIESIATADLVIADLTALNPNVMYELGIAHAINPYTIMIIQDIQQLPFDLRPYRVHEYSQNYRDADMLKAHLREVALGRRSGAITFGNPVSDFAPSSAGINVVRQGASHLQGHSSLPDADEDRGFLDYSLEAEEDQRQLTDHLQRLTTIFNRFSSDSQSILEETNALTANRVQVTTRRRREILSRFAEAINRLSEQFESETPAFRSTSDRLIENADHLFAMIKIHSDEDRKSAEELITTMTEYQATAQGSISMMNDLRSTVQSLRGASQDLNRSLSRLDRVLDEIISVLELQKAYALRTINVLNERLK